MIKNKMRPIAPGEILQEQLDVLKLSARQLAEHLHVPPNRITRILAGVTSITPDTALRLARFFDTTPDFWINLQSAYDLRTAEQNKALLKECRTIEPFDSAQPAAKTRRYPRPKSAANRSTSVH